MSKSWQRMRLKDLCPGALIKLPPSPRTAIALSWDKDTTQLGIYLGGGQEDAWGSLNFNHVVRVGAGTELSFPPDYEVEVYK